ncbi:hypothetical protein [Microbulbifer sp. ANSA005]|uniref:hypothetical protein n=1 Tax=Microbulbifer sp. ANSA005 TaxID=3243362 RepID=UPI004042D399
MLATPIFAYVIEILIRGDYVYTASPKAWESFAVYFNNISGPFLATIAAIVAYLSLQFQLNETRKLQSINQQAENYLKYISLLGGMIDKRWQVIYTYCDINFEHIGESVIDLNKLNELPNKQYMISDVVKLMKLFHDLSFAVQWYTSIHKKQIENNEDQFPMNEWSHLSNAFIRERSKQMKFCYYFGFSIKGSLKKNSNEFKEVIMYENFYENLESQGLV